MPDPIGVPQSNPKSRALNLNLLPKYKTPTSVPFRRRRITSSL